MKPYIVAMLLFAVLSLGFTLAKHGQPRDGNHNFWLLLFAYIFYFGVLWLCGLRP